MSKYIEPLNLSHQQVLSSKFRELNIPLSEYSFANLYLFREVHSYEVLIIESEIFLKGLTYDHLSFIMPTSPLPSIHPSILKQALTDSKILYPIPEDMMHSIENGLVISSFKEEDSDYVYAVNKLATYKGRHLDGQRNQIKHFLNEHLVRCEVISNQFSDMQNILNAWQADFGEERQTDYMACKEAIQHYQSLMLYGHIVYVDENPAGFIIGEWGARNYFTVHFAKGLRSIKGIYQYLYQELAKFVESHCTWMNFEQDLGIPAIQYAKLSYHPDFLMKKWRLQLSF